MACGNGLANALGRSYHVMLLLFCTDFSDALLSFMLSVLACSLLRFLAGRILWETDCGGLTAVEYLLLITAVFDGRLYMMLVDASLLV